MTSIFHGQLSAMVIPFALDDDSTAQVIAQLKEHLTPYCPDILKSLNMPLTYLLDELICNIQQHAQADKGYAYLMYNKAAKTIEILIADFGITIYGSYVAAQKHLDKLGDSDAEALNLAQNGYSVRTCRIRRIAAMVFLRTLKWWQKVCMASLPYSPAMR
jgi:hypothetical protein